MFRANYSFVKGYKEKEMGSLKQTLSEEKDPHQREQLETAITLLVGTFCSICREIELT